MTQVDNWFRLSICDYLAKLLTFPSLSTPYSLITQKYSHRCPGLFVIHLVFHFSAVLCSWCGTWKGDKVCGGCRRAHYCSEKHQVSNMYPAFVAPFSYDRNFLNESICRLFIGNQIINNVAYPQAFLRMHLNLVIIQLLERCKKVRVMDVVF